MIITKEFEKMIKKNSEYMPPIMNQFYMNGWIMSLFQSEQISEEEWEILSYEIKERIK